MSKKNDNFNLNQLLVDNVCSKCNFYNEDLGICYGEILPIQRAIQNNLKGRGLCKDIKDYVTKINEILLKEQNNGNVN